MSFLHSGLIWLLPLAGIPILLHMLMLHRLRTVELSTFRFLMDSYVVQRRRLRFLEWLLAALRALFVAGLVLAFARPEAAPLVPSWLGAGTDAGAEITLLIDASASMEAASGGTTALERAKEAARSLAKKVGDDSRIVLIRMTNRAEVVIERPARERDAIAEAIDGIKPGPGRGNVYAALADRLEGESGRPKSARFYLFTDAQANGWRELREQEGFPGAPSEARLSVVDVGAPGDRRANVAVRGDAPAQHQALVGLPTPLHARVVNLDPERPAEVALGVHLGEKQVDRQSRTLAPGETWTPTFLHRPESAGLLLGRFEVAVEGGDRFKGDDAFLFSLSATERLRVLLVNEQQGVRDPIKDPGVYLRAALATPTPGVAEQGETAELRKAIDPSEILPHALNPSRLAGTSAVILANCRAFNDQHARILRQFVWNGGGLLILPGDVTDLELWNRRFFRDPEGQGIQVVDLALGAAEGDPEKIETAERLGDFDRAHPIFAPFAGGDLRPFRTVRFSRRFPLRAAAGGNTSARVLASFGNGAPALIESRWGEGTILVAAFPAHASWTNFPLKPEFVPWLLRTVAYLARRPGIDLPPSVPPGEPAMVTVSSRWDKVTGTVTDPEGKGEPLTFHPDGPGKGARYDRTPSAGLYRVDVKGSGADSGVPMAASAAFAVNVDPSESDPARVTPGEIEGMVRPIAADWVDPKDASISGESPQRRELWRWLILLGFAILGTEFLLATSSGRPGTGVAERIRDANPNRWIGRMTGAEETPSSS